jgi:hypothetical protein
MTYKGSCHCGRIAFEVDGDLAQAMDCNCCHCIRKHEKKGTVTIAAGS